MLLKNRKKELEATSKQSESNPEKQNKLIAQSMKRFKSTIQQQPLSLEELDEAETELSHG